MQTKTLGLLIILIGVVFWFGVLNTPLLGSNGQPVISGNATNSTKTVSSTAQLIFSANSGVQLRCIANTNGTSSIGLGFGTSTGLTVSTGYVVYASTTKIFTADELYSGDIWAVGPNGTGVTIGICQL